MENLLTFLLLLLYISVNPLIAIAFYIYHGTSIYPVMFSFEISKWNIDISFNMLSSTLWCIMFWWLSWSIVTVCINGYTNKRSKNDYKNTLDGHL
jgi:hypothetical protein